MTVDAPRFLGRGWGFPPRFELVPGADGAPAGRVAMVAGDADIRESLAILMTTLRGERLLDPDYGFGVQERVFDPTDETSLMHFEAQIREAVLFYEPRIKLEEVAFDRDAAADGRLMIRLSYWIPAVNSRANMVFPFYFREGTALPRP